MEALWTGRVNPDTRMTALTLSKPSPGSRSRDSMEEDDSTGNSTYIFFAGTSSSTLRQARIGKRSSEIFQL